MIDLGGTADFSLIAVTERDGSWNLVRVAVGEHILLGGDNMDLAFAHAVRAKLAEQGIQLDPWQVAGFDPRLPVGQRETLLSRAKSGGAGGGAEPRFQTDRRHLAHRTDPRRGLHTLMEGSFRSWKRRRDRRRGRRRR